MRQHGIHSFLAMPVIALALGLAACGGGNPTPPPPAEGSATLDASGGQVDGPDGVRLVVPPGALTAATTLRIARDASGAPELGGAKAMTPIYAITPHGTEFAESARISIPFDAAALAQGTRPVILKAQPGGHWTALASEVVGNAASAADTPSLSYYAVGTCHTGAANLNDAPLLWGCPSAHELKLVLFDGNGVEMPTPRTSTGVALPVMDISAPTTLSYRLIWRRPAGTQRTDDLSMSIFGAGLSRQPLSNLPVNADYTSDFVLPLNPATISGASAANGQIVVLRATASYTSDVFFAACACFRSSTWSFDTELRVRVRYTGTAPVITQQPASTSVAAGQGATFSVVATGTNLSYQWLAQTAGAQSLQPVPGATASTLTTPPAALSQNGLLHQVRVCSNAGTPQQQCVDSALATLNVAAAVVPPVFTTQPASITVIEGQTASFTAVASGQPAPTIGWSRLRATPLGDALDPICSITTGSGSGNSTSATCTVGPLALADSGMRIQAGASNGPNGANTASSNVATITVAAAPVAPSITSPAEPADRTVTAGGSVSWAVGAAGTAPLSYQWRTVTPGGNINVGVVCDGGYNVAPTTSATLTLPNVPQACNGHRFFVVVSNAVSPPAESRRALLTVNAAPAAPAISVPLADRNVVEGTQVTFNVAATGSPASFTHAWTFDGAAVPRVVSGCTATSASCTFTAQLPDSGKTMSVRVANGVAPDATSSATLTVTSTDVAASITAQPQPQGVVAGANAIFTIGVAGTPTPTVAWETSPDGLTWSAAGSGTTLTLANITLAQSGLRVRARVSNTTRVPGGTQLNTVTSSEVMLTVVSNLPPNVLTAVQVATLANRTLAVRPDGSVYAWGPNVDPITGGYTTGGGQAYRPTRVQGLGPVRQVAMGSDYSSWALAQDGTVWGWGFLNSYQAFAQGPNNTALEFLAPVQLLEAANTPVDRVCQIEGTAFGVVMVRSDAVGGTCAANEPRSVWYTANISGYEGTSTRYVVRYSALDSGGTLLPAGRWIREVVSSRNHSIGPRSVFALANDGTVYAWGDLNLQGQLGLGYNNATPSSPQPAAGWQDAVRIAAAAEVTLALMPDGSIRGAGWNPNASLGIGPVSFGTVVVTPTTLAGIAGASDITTASSNSSSMALVGGQLRYWGNNSVLVAGVQASPIAIAAPATPLTSVVVGGRVAYAIGPGNAVYSWGDAQFRGCQPNSTDCNSATTVPTLVTVP